MLKKLVVIVSLMAVSGCGSSSGNTYDKSDPKGSVARLMAGQGDDEKKRFGFSAVTPPPMNKPGPSAK